MSSVHTFELHCQGIIAGTHFSLYQIYAVLRSVTSDLSMIMRITMIILVPEFRISSGSQK